MPAKAMIRICALAAVLRCSVAAPEQEAVVSASRFGPVVPLNRRTFGGNVLEGTHVDHWVVLFCVDWFEPCQEAFAPYMSLAEEHSKRLNQGSLLRDVVRFGMVDCAVDKVLCNEQLVDDYPTVAHYAAGRRLAAWSQGKLLTWLEKELPSQRGAAPAQPLLSEEERSLVLRAGASFAALLAFFLWAVGQGADLWLASSTTMRGRPPPEKAQCWPAPAEAAAAAEGAGGRAVRRLPEDWAHARGSVVL